MLKIFFLSSVLGLVSCAQVSRKPAQDIAAMPSLVAKDGQYECIRKREKRIATNAILAFDVKVSSSGIERIYTHGPDFPPKFYSFAEADSSWRISHRDERSIQFFNTSKKIDGFVAIESFNGVHSEADISTSTVTMDTFSIKNGELVGVESFFLRPYGSANLSDGLGSVAPLRYICNRKN